MTGLTDILNTALSTQEKFDIVETTKNDLSFNMEATDTNDCCLFIDMLKKLKADFFEGFYPSYLELNEKVHELPCEEVYTIKLWNEDISSEVILYEGSFSQFEKALKGFRDEIGKNIGVRIDGARTEIELFYNPILEDFYVEAFEVYFSEWKTLIKVLRKAKLISREDSALLLDTKIKLHGSDVYEDAFIKG